VAARLIGYRSVVRDSVFVQAGATVTLDFPLETNPLELAPLVVTAPVDPVLDPLATSTEQKISAADLRQLPVSSLEEAVALSAGSVGQSYRGGRLGEEAFILDGLGVKNQLDASSGGLGLVIPPDVLSEASLVTNGFSARYGQAISGLINVVTKEPGEEWEGRVGYETDRPFGGSWDLGLDRIIAQANGPVVGRLGVVAAVDVSGRLDADPVNAPAPTDPRDPRNESPTTVASNGVDWGRSPCRSRIASLSASPGSTPRIRVSSTIPRISTMQTSRPPSGSEETCSAATLNMPVDPEPESR
jgi:hypothetical protein